MAAKPSAAVEKALQEIKERVTCGICLDPYKQPRLLKCFHVFCEQCLQPMAQREGGQSLSCPACRNVTPLPEGGVAQLQGAFYIHYLFDVQDVLQKVSSSDKAMCNKCKKREASGFCRTCGFLCHRCTETHQEWDELKSHQIIDLDTLTGDVTTLIPPLNKTIFCTLHPSEIAKLYCETCDQLVCRDCTISSHRDHQYGLVSDSFPKQEKIIADSLKPVEQQIAALERAIESVNVRRAAVVEQSTAVAAEIHTTIAHLRQALEMRGKELVSQAEQVKKQKLKTLTAQRDRLELQLGERRICRDFVKESRRFYNQSEILEMKSHLVKQIDELFSSSKVETLIPAEKADMKFAHSLPEVVKTLQHFGKVYCSPVCPDKCLASGEGIKIATRGKSSVVSVEAFDREGEPYLRPIESLRCELVASDGSSRVIDNVKRRDQNIYDISYQPETTGEHQLHILIEEQPILNSPFTVNVLPNFTAPVIVIGDLKGPWGIAVMEGGEVVVAEREGHCASINSATGARISYFSFGQSFCPSGIAITSEGATFVVDFYKNFIQKFSPSGLLEQTIGRGLGSGPLEFENPVGVAIHPHNQQICITDSGNHRVQVVSSDGSYRLHFGGKGSGNGFFDNPYGVAFDRKGNVYVADRDNHRIQVFTIDGIFMKRFGRKGEREGELKEPVGIAVDSRDLVYVSEWGNNRVSIFSTNGEFFKSFGEFNRPLGLALGKERTLLVSDTNNNRVVVFQDE